MQLFNLDMFYRFQIMQDDKKVTRQPGTIYKRGDAIINKGTRKSKHDNFS